MAARISRHTGTLQGHPSEVVAEWLDELESQFKLSKVAESQWFQVALRLVSSEIQGALRKDDLYGMRILNGDEIRWEEFK